MIRRIADALAGFKAALGIASPSRVFIDAARAAERRQHVQLASLPWYFARGPLEPYETPELAAAARRVRRLIRRHWWALFFEPESSTALSVLEAMATPPEPTQPVDIYQRLLELLDAGKVELRPEYARKVAEQCDAGSSQ